ncbi:flippase [Halomonas sp.]|uniref:flippase n=1 Tax=Halomonas sp. TaxID=1486246 RepID=UPI0038515B7F
MRALKKHQGFRRYAANTSWMMAERLLRILAGLLVGIWVARYLGPEQFGLFSYVLAFAAIFSGIAKLGLDGILVRELVNQPEQRDTYLGTAFWLKVIGAFSVMALIALITPFTSNDATTSLFIFIISAGLAFQSFEVVDFYFQSKVLAKIVSICKVTQLTISSIIKIYLVLTQAELLWFVCVTAFDSFSLGVSYFIAYKIRGNASFFKCFNGGIAKSLLKDSWPLIFSSVLAMVYLKIDQVMIKEILGSYEVGIYSAAVKLTESVYFIPILLTSSLFPAIINAKKRGHNIYICRLKKLYAMLIWSAIFIALFFSISGAYLITLLFGASYILSSEILLIHAWASVFVFLSAGFGRYLMVENLAKINMYRVAVGAILNIIINFLVIERYGIVGAAWATLISLFFVNIVFDMFNANMRSQLKLKMLAFLYPISLLVRFFNRV